MSYLTKVLFWISTSLMVPVIVLLLISFFRSLMMLGGFYGMYMNRLKFKKQVKALHEGEGRFTSDQPVPAVFKKNKIFYEHFSRLRSVGWKKIHADKIISDFELRLEKELESSKTLTRTGPMLGLMGTLIPMGPALVGLAAGDIASMASNMQVAFSTTVIGIFIGGIGYITQLVKQRWGMEDINNLEYFYELAVREEE